MHALNQRTLDQPCPHSLPTAPQQHSTAHQPAAEHAASVPIRTVYLRSPSCRAPSRSTCSMQSHCRHAVMLHTRALAIKPTTPPIAMHQPSPRTCRQTGGSSSPINLNLPLCINLPPTTGLATCLLQSLQHNNPAEPMQKMPPAPCNLPASGVNRLQLDLFARA